MIPADLWSPPRGGGLLLVTLVPAVATSILVVAERLWRARRRRALLASARWGLLEPIPSWSEGQVVCGVAGAVLILLLCYQLAVPADVWPGPTSAGRATAVVRSAAAVVCASAILVHVGRLWSVNLADIALALLTLAACTLATVFVPDEPRELDERYPLIFNAIVFALGLMTWVWGWLAEVWHQQLDQGVPDGRDPAWTTAGRLVPVNRRFSQVTGAGGLMVAAIMSVWPALRTVSADDDSLGRMSAGVAAHLLLLLASMRCARWTRRPAFRILSLFVLLSMVVFVVVRARRYTG